MLILLNKKAIALLTFSKAARVNTSSVCKPQNGEIPTNIPKAMAAAFLSGES